MVGKMKIIYIDIDTLSPSHMGCYGYGRDTTPNIDKLVQEKETAMFKNMYTSDAPCLPSRTSLVTGQFGIRHGAVDHGGKYADIRSEMHNRDFQHTLENDGLFGVFKRGGLRTTSISSFSNRHSSWHFNCGFNEVYCYGDSAVQQAPEIHELTKDWLDRNGQTDDWVLHVHMWDPHTPYRAPESYQPSFVDEPFDYFVNDELLKKHRELIGPHTATTLDMFSSESETDFKRDLGQINNLAQLKTTVDGYDIGIHYADHHIGLIIEQLKELGIYDETVVVVSADHGENMGELGKYSEHGTADVGTCHIPFIIKIPNHDYRNCDFDKYHYNLDILPTVYEYLNLQPLHKTTLLDGKSFLDVLKTGIDKGHEYLVLSQMSHVLQRSVLRNNKIYIKTYHDGYHPYFESDMLFDLKEDEHEQKNIAPVNLNIVKEFKAILFDWTNDQMSRLQHKHCEDPLWYIYHNGGPHHAHQFAQLFIDNLEKAKEYDKAAIVKEYYSAELDKNNM